jgi:hypothetical protein
MIGVGARAEQSTYPSSEPIRHRRVEVERISGSSSVQARGFDFIGTIEGAHENFVDLRMANGIAGGVGHEILLRDIGDIFGVGVFGEEMIERLVLARPDFRRNRLPPFLGIREDRVDVVDNSPEGIFPVFDDLTNGEFRDMVFHARTPPLQATRTGRRGGAGDEKTDLSVTGLIAA